jgi:hypothetical protein
MSSHQHLTRALHRIAAAALTLCALSLVIVSGASAETSEAPAPPPNDARTAAQHIATLPSTIEGTTVGATLEPNETESHCASATTGSVWYTLRTPTRQRIAVDLAAGGALDGTIDVYHAVRSQLIPAACNATNSKGHASLSFESSKNGVYYIRVAALNDSLRATFTLEAFLPTPPVEPPGPRLPANGVNGHVDRIQNINAAYSVPMSAGVSYMISLANETEGGCVSGHLYAPSTQSFESGSSLLHISCGGFRLFTPGPGEGGIYSFEITPELSYSPIQRFHLQVAPAGAAETSPGISLGNYANAHGYLDGRSVRVLRLYRLDITSHSNLTLKLSAPNSAELSLQLRGEHGNVIECDCEGSGSQTLQRQMTPGHYYAVVSVRDATAGAYTLERESRTITSTSLSFSTSKALAGVPTGIDVKVSPAASGPVAVDIERFDPVFGWQFYAQEQGFVSDGTGGVGFTPPAIGRWRAKANYSGSRTSSPSAVGFSYLLVT